jgi:dienelactone hydrolase
MIIFLTGSVKIQFVKNMNLLIVSDIFGRTNALDDLADYFEEKKIQTEILDPYDRRYMNFKNENQAYSAFHAEIGLGDYINLLKQKLTGKTLEKTVILGFSVGASAIWAVSHNIEEDLFKGICFYSSQIRNYMELRPKMEIELYFAKAEPAYDVDAVVSKLEINNKVTCFKTNFMHGFMNERSKNFNEDGFLTYREIIKTNIARHFTGFADVR